MCPTWQANVPLGSQESSSLAENTEEQRWPQQQTALQSLQEDSSAIHVLSIVHSLAAQQKFRQAKVALVAASRLLDEEVLRQEAQSSKWPRIASFLAERSRQRELACAAFGAWRQASLNMVASD